MEQVILLDEAGRQIGVADKAVVHHANTPLHLAFSCYVFDPDGRLLLTQRAAHKKTWPGVWTNTCCGNPSPGEPMATAVHRRLSDELGIAVDRVDLVLPRFRYRAVMDNGVVENEMCPVFRAIAEVRPQPNPDEVDDTRWVDWTTLLLDVAEGRQPISPWARLQLAELSSLPGTPADWPAAPTDDLPAAAA